MADKKREDELQNGTPEMTIGRFGNLVNQGVERAVAGLLATPSLVVDGYANIFRVGRELIKNGGNADITRVETSHLYDASKQGLIHIGRTLDGSAGNVVGPQTKTEENIVFGAELVSSVVLPAGTAGTARNAATAANGVNTTKAAATTARIEPVMGAAPAAANAAKAEKVVAEVVENTASRTAGRTTTRVADDISDAKILSETTHAGTAARTANTANTAVQFGKWDRLRLNLMGYASIAGVTTLTGGIAYTAAENMSNGAVSEAVGRYVIDAVLNSDVDPVEAAEAVDNAFEKLSVFMPSLKKSVQNGAVLAELNSGEGTEEDRIQEAKRVSMLGVFMPGNAAFLTARHGFRAMIADEKFSDKNDADRFLAEGMVRDLVEGAQVNALGKNNATRDDYKAMVAEILTNPEEHKAAYTFLQRSGRVLNGMSMMWPDMADTIAQSRAEYVAARQRKGQTVEEPLPTVIAGAGAGAGGPGIIDRARTTAGAVADRASEITAGATEQARQLKEEAERVWNEKAKGVFDVGAYMKDPHGQWDKVKSLAQDVPGMSELVELGEKYPTLKWGMMMGGGLGFLSNMGGGMRAQMRGIAVGMMAFAFFADIINMITGQPSAMMAMKNGMSNFHQAQMANVKTTIYSGDNPTGQRNAPEQTQTTGVETHPVTTPQIETRPLGPTPIAASAAPAKDLNTAASQEEAEREAKAAAEAQEAIAKAQQSSAAAVARSNLTHVPGTNIALNVPAPSGGQNQRQNKPLWAPELNLT